VLSLLNKVYFHNLGIICTVSIVTEYAVFLTEGCSMLIDFVRMQQQHCTFDNNRKRNIIEKITWAKEQTRNILLTGC